MKVGIVTFHRALNYGALLQAFALRYSLSKIGADAYLLDYRNPLIEKLYEYPSFFQRKTIKEKIKYLIQGKNELKRRKKFEEYRRSFLNLSEDVYNPANIINANGKFDKFITGSDQVWNYGAHDFDKNFFLNFVKEKNQKYSYAASFGISSLLDEYKNQYFGLLNEFSVCSVREEQGLNILSELGIENRRIDMDPTLLLTDKEWLEQFDITCKKDYKYIFAYYFELTDSLRSYIENLARKSGCCVVYLGNPLKSPFKCRSKAVKNADPIDFVKIIANAEYVVTNSFHGTAFSIIFNKNFYVELLKTDSKVNSRIENILKTYSLENRIISRNQEQSDIDWLKINNKADQLRAESFEYLREIVL